MAEIECCDTVEVHEDLLKIVKETMPDEKELNDLADLFKIFGDYTRIRILFVLFEAEVCVCDLAQALDMTQSAISHQLKILKQRDDILVSTSLYNNLEINGPGASKGEGLLHLASMLGIRREETMAFGDGNNDASMIRDAGIGVVMENGDPDLKGIADYITATNDESGVAQAIEKLVLSGENK